MKGSVAGFCCLLCAHLLAEDYSTYLQMQTPDTGWRTSSFTRENWGSNSEAAKSDLRYYVPEGWQFDSPTTAAAFPGASLALAGKFMINSSGGTTQTFNELRLLPGAICKHQACNYLSASSIVIESTSATPAQFQYFWNEGYVQQNKYVVYTGPVSGEAGTALKVGRSSVMGLDRDAVLAQESRFNCELTNYRGTVIAGEETAVQLGYRRADYQTSGIISEFPGTLEIEAGSYVCSQFVTGKIILGGLRINPGAELDFYVNGGNGGFTTYTVTDRFEASGDIKIGFRYDREYSFGLGDHLHGLRLIHLTQEAVANSTFDLSGTEFVNFKLKDGCNLPKNMRLGVFDNDDGTKDIGIVWDPFKAMIKNNSSNGSSKPIAFEPDNEDCWADNAIPTSDYEGDVYIKSNCALDLRAWANYSFPKMNLTIPASTVYFQAASLTVNELHIGGGAGFCTYNNASTPTVNGKFVTYAGSGVIGLSGSGDKTFRIPGEMSGDGNLKLYPLANATTSINLELGGANTNFTGSIVVTSIASQWDPNAEPALDKCNTLSLNDGRNLGGPCETDGWRALMVENHAIVEAKDDVIVTEPTRGVYVKTAARFVVPEEKTMSFAAPITYGGELTKLGAGRLALGKAQFSATGATPIAAPTAGLNVLNVEGGSVSANDTDAFAGLAVSFAAGTSLCVDLGATDADLIATGADLRKAGTSLAVADAALKVTFCGGSAETTDGKTVAICTVPAAMAQTLKLDAAHKAETATGRMSVSVTSKTNDDGSVTYLATAFKGGVLLIVR